MSHHNKDYFGYGERTPPMMEAIIGRIPKYSLAMLPGFRLFIQRAVDLPGEVREILAVNRSKAELKNFRAYAAFPDDSTFVRGLIYREITESENEILDNWDIEGLWFNRLPDRIINVANDEGGFGRIGMADTLANPNGARTSTDVTSDGLYIFPPPLNDQQRTLDIARQTREAFLLER